MIPPRTFAFFFGSAARGVCDTCNRLGSVVSAAAHGATGIANAILYPLSEIGSLFMNASDMLLWVIAIAVVASLCVLIGDDSLVNEIFDSPTAITGTSGENSTKASGNSFRERAGRHFEAAKDLLIYATTGDDNALNNARKNTMLGNRIEGILNFFNLRSKDSKNPQL